MGTNEMALHIDQIIERDRARDVDAFWSTSAPTPTQPLSQWLNDMPLTEFAIDSSDFLLCYADASTSELQQWLAEAQEQLENHPGEESAYFKSCAAKIVSALLRSAQNYRGMTQ
jgi:hypothetical protein